MSDGYTKYTGNAAGGANTNPKPGPGVKPQVIIPADGYVPTSAMFQQFEQTLADFAAYGSLPADGYSQKYLYVDGVGGQPPPGFISPGDGYLIGNLNSTNVITSGAIQIGTTLQVGSLCNLLSTTNVSGLFSANGGMVTAQSLATGVAAGGPVSGHVYKNGQVLCRGTISDTGSVITVVEAFNLASTPIHFSTTTGGFAAGYIVTMTTPATNPRYQIMVNSAIPPDSLSLGGVGGYTVCWAKPNPASELTSFIVGCALVTSGADTRGSFSFTVLGEF